MASILFKSRTVKETTTDGVTATTATLDMTPSGAVNSMKMLENKCR
jgi:hypothetical protein